MLENLNEDASISDECDDGASQEGDAAMFEALASDTVPMAESGGVRALLS